MPESSEARERRRVRARAYPQSPAAKALRKLRDASPERKAKRAEYRARADWRAKQAAYNASPAGKASQAKYKNGGARWRIRGLPEPTRPMPTNCECCEKPDLVLSATLHLDHDHANGKFRGWLCGPCNRAIGQLGDTVDGVRRALEYLERNTCPKH